VAVVIGTNLTVSTEQELLTPPMSAEPLQTALHNANACYCVHRPPLVSVFPIVRQTQNRAISFTVPVVPSADAIRYACTHWLLGSFAASVPVTVESGIGEPPTWTSLYSGSVTLASGVYNSCDHHVILPAPSGCDRLRFTYTPPTGPFLVSSILVYPDPDPASAPIGTAAQMPSGFWPADDALLGVTSGPVHTEMLDRCWRNSIAVLRDRQQMVASWVQADTQFGGAMYATPFDNANTGDQWALVGKARVGLPYQQGTVLLRAAVLADVSSGATSKRVRLVAKPLKYTTTPPHVDLDATGHIVTGHLAATVDGTVDAGVDLEVYVRNISTQTLTLRAVVLHWCPGD